MTMQILNNQLCLPYYLLNKIFSPTSWNEKRLNTILCGLAVLIYLEVLCKVYYPLVEASKQSFNINKSHIEFRQNTALGKKRFSGLNILKENFSFK